jgi:hypothetical protein
MVVLFHYDTSLTVHQICSESRSSAIINKLIEEFQMDLSELIDEIREIEIYETNPEDWMGYIEYDDLAETDLELAY